MNTIEVDFDVFKQLTVRRETESVSYNDVIRELLGLGQGNISAAKEATSPSPSDWIAKGVIFPAGTEFRAAYKGQVRAGHVEDGKLVVDGQYYDSPSAAARAITGNYVNGWRFWDCRFPGKSTWQRIENLRIMLSEVSNNIRDKLHHPFCDMVIDQNSKPVDDAVWPEFQKHDQIRTMVNDNVLGSAED